MSDDKNSFEENDELDNIFDEMDDNDADDMFAEFDDDESNDEVLDDDFLSGSDDDDDDFLKEEEEKEEDFFSNENDDIFSEEKEEKNSDTSDIFEDNTLEEEEPVVTQDDPIQEKETPKVEEESAKQDPEELKEEEKEETPKVEKNKNKETVENKSGAKAIAISVAIASAISMGGSYGLFSYMNPTNEINEMRTAFNDNKGEMDILRNAVLQAETSAKNVNFEMDALSSKVDKIDNLEQESKKVKKLISLTIQKANKNERSYDAINKKIDALPNSTIQVAQKIVALEKKLSELDNFDEYKEMLSGVKVAVRKQQNDISNLKKKVKTNMSNIKKSNVAYRDLNEKALKNAQKITQNIKGIRNVNQKVMGESSVKDLLKQSQSSSSKDVRAVSLLFDNNKTVEINNDNIGYNIIGSIENEAFYVEESNGEITSYEIGDYLDGYGRVKAIKDNKIVETDAGVVKNTNKD